MVKKTKTYTLFLKAGDEVREVFADSVEDALRKFHSQAPLSTYLFGGELTLTYGDKVSSCAIKPMQLQLLFEGDEAMAEVARASILNRLMILI